MQATRDEVLARLEPVPSESARPDAD
jgi:hypothetical protein